MQITEEFNTEELRWMSQLLAETLLEQSKFTDAKAQFTLVTYVSGYEIIKEDKIIEEINLDLIASVTAGIEDPLGQLREWFTNLINSIASFIISSIESFIDTYVTPTLHSISGTVSTILTDLANIPSRVALAITYEFPTLIRNITDSVVASIETVILDPVRSFIDWVLAQAVAIRGFIETIIYRLGSILDFIDGLIASLLEVFTDLTTTISSTLSNLADSVTTIFTRLANTITTTLDSMLNGVVTSVTSLSDTIVSILRGIPDTISNIVSIIMSALRAIPDVISDIVSTILSILRNIPNIISDVVSTILSILRAIPDTISDVVSTILSALRAIPDVISDIVSTILSALRAIPDVISDIVSTILSILRNIPNIIANIITTITNIIMRIQTTIESTLIKIIDIISIYVIPAIKDIADILISTLAPITTFISETVIPALRTIPDFISTYIIPQITKIPDLININVIMPILAIPKTLDMVVEEVLGVTVIGGFTQIATSIWEFVNAILKFPEWFPKWFNAEIATPITTAFEEKIIEPLKTVFEENFVKPLIRYLAKPEQIIRGSSTLTHSPSSQLLIGWTVHFIRPDWSFIFSTPYDLVSLLIESLAGFYKSYIEPVITDAINMLWSGAKEIWNAILNGIKEFAETVKDATMNIAKTIGKLLTETFQALYKIFYEIGEPFGSFVRKIYEFVIESTTNQMTDFSAKLFEGILKAFKIGTPEFLTMDTITSQLSGLHAYTLGMWFLPFWGQLPIRMSQWTMRAFARWLSDHDWKIRINLRPLGIGVDTEFNLAKAISSSIWHTSTELMKWLDEIGRGVIYGYAIWITRPMTRLTNWYLRNILPVEIPREDIILEFTRRMIPHKKFNEILNIARYYTAIYGYSDMVLDQFFKSPEELFIKVTDRFGATRNIPLSLLYQLPSASDVATMMVRDIFATIKDFQNLYMATGMMPDIGALYYFLRFRYPPPEKLWAFTVRGISGLLWAIATPEELELIKKEAEPLSAPLPKSPAELNFQHQALLNAFKTYMKWHDYARFSWIKDFPSDNLIYIDTLADIPTKIDQRWMIKWGLYELLSAKQVKLDSPIPEFRTKIIENTAKSEIVMDLTLFARTLQATGLHPDWVPLTAVAEAMNALTDERTLLRTGFISLFKEGFWDVKSLEILLAGIVMASFQVSYFDSKKLEWGTGWVNQPVMFLPAERKLLELRALMDRSLDILKETQRDISRGYSEWIIDTYDEYKGLLTKIIDQINIFFSADYKAITGLDLPENLQLQFVEAYYKPYIASLTIWRDIYTVRRVRYWTQRWLGWIMYRVATGVVKREDMEQLITYVVKYAKLTKYETEFFNGILDIMYRMAVREYIPTPTMLATLSEYMVIPTAMIKKAFTDRLVPEEWRPIWGKYIEIRPVADDIKALLTTYRRALLYAVIPDEIKKAVENYAKLIGFTDREWAVLQLRVTLEELILQSKEYIPTPMMLATISEYVPRAREFFDEVMKARRVPKEWQPIWAEYVDLRPIISEVRRMYTRIEDLYVYFMITKEEFMKHLEELTKFGYTKKEIELMLASADHERHARAWRELIGDVDRMVMVSEYSPKARAIALGTMHKMIDALPIDQQTKNMLKEMWEQYIRLRPIMDEVRRYITELMADFAEGIITEQEYVKELEALKEWGLDDFEVMFYKAIGGLRKARYLRRRAGG